MLVSFLKLKKAQEGLLKFDENMSHPWLGGGCIRGRSVSVSYAPTDISVLFAVCGTVSCLTRPTSCRIQNRRASLSYAMELHCVDYTMRPLIGSSWQCDRTIPLRFVPMFSRKPTALLFSTRFKDFTTSPLCYRESG